MPLLSTLAEYPYHSIVGTFLLCTALKTILTRKKRNPNGLPLPPGPKGLPIIGNLLDMPKDKPWLAYDDWCKVYGDMVYFEVLGQPFIVLGSLEKTYDLFEKRSSNYSDRMRMPMVLELMHWDYNMAMLPYGQWWRRHRRAFHEHFHPGVVAKHQPVQLHETRAFLQRLLDTPDNFLHHVRHTFAATIMRVAYGITVKESEDPYILNAEQALYGLAEAGIPGSFLVDLIPALKYIPDWFPGATFQKKATRWRNINKDVALKPFEYVKEQMTVSAVQTFFLAMARYPEVMKKAQAELDAVIGNNRLPEFSDRPSLPYINAMVKESMRWQLIIPLAVGHMATEDDEYNGYFIPKGTVLMGNGWSILHDPEVFDHPEEYIPERYLGADGQLDPNARNPTVAAFGYGRRICPGRHMSDNALFMIIASTLAVYDIQAPLDANGKPVKPKAEFTSGLLSMTLLSAFSEHPYLSAVLVIVASVLISNARAEARRNPRRLPRPPGPKGLPIIGNMMNMPKYNEDPWIAYDQMRKKYGDMIYMEVLGRPFLVLNTLEKVDDLLDKRSLKYSSRPHMTMLLDLMGWDINFGLLPYGQKWREDRRTFHEHFGPGAIEKRRPILLSETHKFLMLLLTRPNQFPDHIRYTNNETPSTFGATIMRIAYGINIEPNSNNKYLLSAERALASITEAAAPGRFLVDLIPVLKHVPKWFPGAAFQRKAEEWRKIQEDFVEAPYQYVTQRMKEGNSVSCMLTMLLESLPPKADPKWDEEHKRAKTVPAVAFAGGSETTVSAVTTFFLAMVMYPEVMGKAQKEIDLVVGPERLPTFSDRDSLPYTNAILKEIMRWRIIANLGLAHMLSEDDEYEGYFIPKGTIVMGNAWSILHDPQVFRDPEEFIPERYLKDGLLDPEVLDPTVAVFGHGRRICPGQSLADQQMFILIASTLASFDIRAPLDAAGKPIMPSGKYKSGGLLFRSNAVLHLDLLLLSPCQLFVPVHESMSFLSSISEHPYLSAVLIVITGILTRNARGRRQRNPRGLPRPPGPKGYPIIGNLMDMPKLDEYPWIAYDQMQKDYGDMIYMEVLGKPFLILSTLEKVDNLLDQRSLKYSSRPHLTMILELMGWDINFGLLPYGQRWREDRRTFHEHFGPSAIDNHRPILLEETNQFLMLLLEKPEKFFDHIRYTFGAVVMRITYGIKIEPNTNNKYMINAERANATLKEAAVPGRFMVDLIPALKYIPKWFPGASFQRKAAEWSKVREEFIDVPYQHVAQLMKEGSSVPCMLTSLLSRLPSETDPKWGEEFRRAKTVPAIAFAGGSETTVSAVTTFFLAMVMHPEVMDKAQKEIDSVVGLDRLPTFSDRGSLPYICAIIKEILRWRVVTPLGLAHCVSEDDEYEGYFIPKGTIVMGNIWSIMHDPQAFQNPERFIPERYMKNGQLNPDIRDPRVAVFGHGRRVCPGQFLSDQQMFILIASTLAAFDIRAPLDATGKPIMPRGEYTSGALSGLPKPPGPKGYPIIGNLWDMPKIEETPWVEYDKMRDTYGDMIYFEVLGQPFLILGSYERVQDLFEKRSSNYSSRPHMPMVMDLMDWHFNFSFLPYGHKWKKDRRVFHDFFHPGVIEQYHPILVQEGHAFLRSLIKAPKDLQRHIRHTFASSIMRVTYGITIQPSNDDIYVVTAERALKSVSDATVPGTFLVDLIPAMKYIPEWFPGAHFQRQAAVWRGMKNDFLNLPFNHVKRLMATGDAVQCILTTLIDQLPDENHPERFEAEERAKSICAIAFAGGADTTVSALHTFFLAMTMYPEAQKKAQAELDAVVGSHRLPDFSDRPMLPYINALIKECLRWHGIANLGLAHSVSEDDEYNGYFIPKGTIVMGNTWAILHDPDVFEKPDEFIPERYLKDGKLDTSVRDPSVAAFGYGRRICPGRYFSDQNMYILVAFVLAAFDIRAPLNEKGEPVYYSLVLGLKETLFRSTVRLNFGLKEFQHCWRKVSFQALDLRLQPQAVGTNKHWPGRAFLMTPYLPLCLAFPSLRMLKYTSIPCCRENDQGVQESACLALVKVIARTRRNPKGLPRPPGPKGYPIIGNLWDMPNIEDKPWVEYNKMKDTYGDMIYFEVLGQPFLILGSYERAQDLFEKRSSNYSNRPHMPMVMDLMDWHFNFVFLPYGNKWRKYRRVFHDFFHSGVINKYQPILVKEAHAFLRSLLQAPKDLQHHIRHTFISSIMRITYGITIQPSNDDIYVLTAERALKSMTDASVPGTFLVDLIPAMKYIPEWFPGASFQRQATVWQGMKNDFLDLPFNHVKRSMENGSAVPCILTTLLDQLPNENDPERLEAEERAKGVCAVAFAGGADTTASALHTFFLAMTMYPEAQKKAQAELDAVVGFNRLPDFGDRPSLPYINALIKECSRWQAVANLGLAHSTSEDDEYNGYFIPKGTIVMGNTWAILNDPDAFETPQEFIPERYLKDGQLDTSVRDPSVAAFGYGRRICPGRFFSDQNMFILVAFVLAAFDIRAPLNEKGVPIRPQARYTSAPLS
ncbi:hypothetical protein CVT24_001217 [Panaeolus cyanescens]|uniref:Cytochrome P450 n=1 Tax=Panaeolus cyanescens TaxID=181874 RepID=A0A409VTR3_9AGAR|nr:hypothetical protein CVT24_001217 [Panaeolus cyanescens]